MDVETWVTKREDLTRQIEHAAIDLVSLVSAQVVSPETREVADRIRRLLTERLEHTERWAEALS